MIQFYVAMLEHPEDEPAFTALYYQYLPLLTKEAEKFFKDTGLADDALSLAWEVVAKQFVKISSIDCQKRAAYLVIIVRNKCRDILRQEKRHREYAASVWDEETVWSADVADTVIEKEDEIGTLKLFEALREPYREVMERRHMLGESNREVAQNMGVSPALASKWYERARGKLAEKLMEEGAFHA